jgi:hypothetical protein
LYGVTADNIQFKNDTGMTENVSYHDVLRIEIAGYEPVSPIVNSSKLFDFMSQKNKTAAQAKLNLLDHYREELSLLAKKIPALGGFFEVKHIRDIPFLSADTREKCIEEIEESAKNTSIPAEAITAALVLVDFAAKNFASCANRYVSRILSKNFKGELPLAFLYNQMNDANQCFFWLTQYFLRDRDENDRDNPLWWFYLQNAAACASFEEIPPMLKTVSQKNIRLAMESLAYLFVLNGSRTQAAFVLASLDIDAEEASEICENYCLQLRSDPDNQYHRYLRCFNEIIGRHLLTKYEQSEGICGYVYDFVPARSYGNILGYDLLRYFFHSNEDNCSSSAISTIRKNICTLKTVAEEDLVMVTFRRSGNAKRTYEALNIV